MGTDPHKSSLFLSTWTPTGLPRGLLESLRIRGRSGAGWGGEAERAGLRGAPGGAPQPALRSASSRNRLVPWAADFGCVRPVRSSPPIPGGLPASLRGVSCLPRAHSGPLRRLQRRRSGGCSSRSSPGSSGGRGRHLCGGSRRSWRRVGGSRSEPRGEQAPPHWDPAVPINLRLAGREVAPLRGHWAGQTYAATARGLGTG